MTEMHHTHWTDDEELLARFVLGRLDPQQAAVLEQHLTECAECSVVVEAERLLAAGIKRSGRLEMKQRLATSIARKDLGDFNWSRVASVAAAILFAVTIWYVSRWFMPDETPRFVQRVSGDSLSPQAPPLRERPNVPQDAMKALPKDFVDAYPLQGNNGGRKRVAAAEGERGKKSDTAALGATGAITQNIHEVSSSEIWVEGLIVSDARPTEQVAAPMADAVDERLRRDAPKGKEMMALARTERPEVVEVDSMTVTVKQLPLAALHDRRRDAENAKQLIQTFVKKTSRGLDVTIFADSLQKAATRTAPAEGEVIGTDSLVIQIGNRRIAYKFPTGWIRKVHPRPDVEVK